MDPQDAGRTTPSREPVEPVVFDQAAKSPEAARPAPAPARRVVTRSRAGALWTAAAIGLLALAVILIFVAQNSGKVNIHFLMLDGTMPLGVALLVAAILGALLMFAIGSVRILQLRRMARRR